MSKTEATSSNQLIALAEQAFRAGAHEVARALTTQILKSSPEHSKANEIAAYLAGNAGHLDQAFSYLKRATESSNASPEAHYYLASMQSKRGAHGDAMRSLLRAVALSPSFFEAHHDLGLCLALTGDFAGAVDALTTATKLRPQSFQALHNLTQTLIRNGRFEDALASSRKALAIQPRSALVLLAQGDALYGTGDFVAATKSYTEAHDIDPACASAWSGHGAALDAQGLHGEALTCHDEALRLSPDSADVLTNRGIALTGAGRLREALESHETALRRDPTLANAWANRGTTLRRLNRWSEALESFKTATHLAPTSVQIWLQYGDTLMANRSPSDAAIAFAEGLSLAPHRADILIQRGLALKAAQQHEEAADCFARALCLDPELPGLHGLLLHARQAALQWEGQDDLIAEIKKRMDAGLHASGPFPLIAAGLSASYLCRAAANELALICRLKNRRPAKPRRSHTDGRLRIGYFSSDFRDHPVGHLVAGLIQGHDRRGFVICGVSLTAPDRSSVGSRLRSSFDHWIDLTDLALDAALAKCDALELDIAVDLNGLTEGSRPELFDARVAPIQVAYLGFPGPGATPSCDYLLADRFVITPESRRAHDAPVAYLPDCMFVSDDRQRQLPAPPSRKDLGLPENDFVFCAFNASFKISRKIFQVWMAILNEVPSSVLWLSLQTSAIRNRLIDEACALGVDSGRLIFAPRADPRDAHIARMAAADLFLDTPNYNAHTTTNDALWAGLPVLTVPDDTMAGRIAGSQVIAAGLPDFVAADLSDYTAKAVRWGRNRSELLSLRKGWQSSRMHRTFFQTSAHVAGIERAFKLMRERLSAGLGPEDLDVTLA